MSHRASTSSHLSQRFFPGTVWLVTERDLDMAKATPLESEDKYLQVCCFSCLHLSLCPSKDLLLLLSSCHRKRIGHKSSGARERRGVSACWRVGSGKEPWLCRRRCDGCYNQRGCRNSNTRRTVAPALLHGGVLNALALLPDTPTPPSA